MPFSKERPGRMDEKILSKITKIVAIGMNDAATDGEKQNAGIQFFMMMRKNNIKPADMFKKSNSNSNDQFENFLNKLSIKQKDAQIDNLCKQNDEKRNKIIQLEKELDLLKQKNRDLELTIECNKKQVAKTNTKTAPLKETINKTIIPFGKYKGLLLTLVFNTDRPYIEWMLKISDLDPTLRREIEKLKKGDSYKSWMGEQEFERLSDEGAC